jgi:hypothetical protein
LCRYDDAVISQSPISEFHQVNSNHFHYLDKNIPSPSLSHRAIDSITLTFLAVQLPRLALTRKRTIINSWQS